MARDVILVAGANGGLGGTIVRKLRQQGKRVRALSRDAKKLETFASVGAEPFAADMLDRAAMDRACQDVTQVVSTANNTLGKGARSCKRIDEPMYRTFGAAAKAAGVDRWIHVSARNLAPDSPVDAFRVKLRVDDIVRAAGVPWVLIRPSAFMDVWAGVLFGNPDRPGAVATVFGRGDRVVNYISVDDVASFVLAILGNPAVQNEIIDIGGPSEVNFIEFSAAIQRAMGVPETRRHVPAPVLAIARQLARPFNEVAARLASLGYFSTLSDRRFPEWRTAATRFGVEPLTLEQFATRFAPR